MDCAICENGNPFNYIHICVDCLEQHSQQELKLRLQISRYKKEQHQYDEEENGKECEEE